MSDPCEETTIFERIAFPELVRDEPSDFSGWTRARLYQRARELGIPGRSRLNKAGLLEAIRAAD